jgi:hypothetical protein
LTLFAFSVLAVAGCGGECEVSPAGEATLTGFSNTPDCVRSKAEETSQECYGAPPRVEVFAEGLEIEIVHQNACFNCCMDTILVDLEQEGRRIILTESEVVTHPCRCICPFRVTATVAVDLPGEYRIEIYALEELIWTGEVTVTGS